MHGQVESASRHFLGPSAWPAHFEVCAHESWIRHLLMVSYGPRALLLHRAYTGSVQLPGISFGELRAGQSGSIHICLSFEVLMLMIFFTIETMQQLKHTGG